MRGALAVGLLTAALAASPGVTTANEVVLVNRETVPLEFLAEAAPMIAEVRVANVHPYRYNTVTGEAPTSGTTPSPEQSEWSSFRLVELEVTRVYRGDPTLDVLLTSDPGPNVSAGTLAPALSGWEGIVFVLDDSYAPLATSRYTDLPWLYHAGLRLDVLQSEGVDATFHAVAASYWYNRRSGTAISGEAVNRDLPIGELRRIVEEFTPNRRHAGDAPTAPSSWCTSSPQCGGRKGGHKGQEAAHSEIRVGPGLVCRLFC